MTWVVDLPVPFDLGTTCAICDEERAFGTTTTRHSNVALLGTVTRTFSLAVPCGPRCLRRLKSLTIAAWTLFLLPWPVLMTFPLWQDAVGADSSILPWVVSPMVLGWAAGGARWWTLRAVRVLDSDGGTARVAFRSGPAAKRVARGYGAEPRFQRWTG